MRNINSTGLIRKTETADIYSSVSIFADHNELDILYETNLGAKENNFSSTLQIPERENFYSSVFLELDSGNISSLGDIKNLKEVISRAAISDINGLDIVYYTPRGGNAIQDFINRVGIPERRDFFSAAVLKPFNQDVASKYFMNWVEQMRSALRIAGHNELDIIYTAIQAPIQELTSLITQDAYTRQSRPTLNHGGRASLITGKAIDGEYITYIDINLTQIREKIQQGFTIREIDLLISSADSRTGTISLYEVLTPWNEFAINWLTPITLGNKITDYQITSNQLSIDLRNYILSNTATTLRIAIKSDEFFFLRSRESTHPPSIRLRYSDPHWQAFADEYHFMSRAIIRELDNRDFYSMVRILDQFLMNSKVIIEKLEKDLPSQSMIRSEWNNFDGLSGSAKIELLKSHIQSTVIINSLAQNKDVSSSYHNPNSSLSSNANIIPIANIISTVSILSEIYSESFESRALLLRYNIQSIAEIVEKMVIASRALIRNADFTEVQSKAELDFMGRELSSRASIIISQPADTMSRAAILGGGLESEYRLRLSKDLNSRTLIRANIFNDLNSAIRVTVSRIDHDLPSRAKFDYPSVSIYSSSVIQKSGFRDLRGRHTRRISQDDNKNSSVQIKQVLNIKAIADILHYTLIQSKGIIRQFDINEITSRFFVRDDAIILNRNGRVIIRRRDFNYFENRGELRTSARKWIPNKHAPEIFNYEDRRLPRIWVP